MATKLKTVGEELDAMDKAREANLRIWSALGKTDPAHTKGFKRSGGFQGTAIKPIWITQRLTEQFGPCGAGWGFEAPQFQLVTSGDDLMVYCTATAWYMDGGKQHFLYGVGGDQVRGKNKYGFYSDDEAFKKAFTDALGNAFKFVGVGADVHMGLFEDSKYLAEMKAEFTPANDSAGKKPTDDPKPTGKEREGDMSPTALRGSIKTLVRNINGTGSLEEFEELLQSDDAVDVMEQCARRFPAWWETGEGCPAEFTPLKRLIEQTRRGLADLEKENA